ncbi:beta-galactosidase [Luteolibacter algae]|uniref:Beta-galactosidase n=1 Tax=Luteolibacter algae TaxID=454151 RepID=A0ABW5DAE6_9BACT
MTKILQLPLMLAGVLSCMPLAAQNDSKPAEKEWLELKGKVAEKEKRLLALIKQAEEKGLNTDYASVSRTVLSTFQKAAEFDFQNLEEVRKIFQTYGYYSKIDPAETENLPVYEMTDCLTVADFAIAELEQQLQGALSLEAPVDFSKGGMTLEDAYYRKDGRIVFPSTITWMGDSEEMLEAFGRMGGGYYGISFLGKDGKVSKGRKDAVYRRAKEETAKNMAPADYFIGHHAAGWMEEAHPEILDGARHFTKYDIDNPFIRESLDQLFSQMLPGWSQAFGNVPKMHLLANEPNFSTQQGGWLAKNGVSGITMAKYRQWIVQKYKTLAALNESHGTEYTSYDQVHVELPIDKTLRGTAVWYDWCRFNMDRVNEWFTFLKKRVHAYDPEKSPVTIKMLGYILGDEDRDDGMDMEYLTRLQEIVGADLRVTPRGAQFFGKNEVGNDPEKGWQAYYDYEWQEQSMYLDFSKSLCPDRPFYDSEWHGLSSVSWRHFDLKREYVRSSLWLAFTHGMGAINPWLWGRSEDGALGSNADHIGELSTQPIALDAYGRVMKELNAHSEHVAGAVPDLRKVMIYYCEESAIQTGEYIAGVKAVYEALKLLNVPVGFATPSMLSELNLEKQTLLITPTPFITDKNLKGLGAFIEGGGRVMTVGPERSFVKNELGKERGEKTTLDTVRSFAESTIDGYCSTFRKEMDADLFSMSCEVRITDADGKPAYGVIITQHPNEETGVVSITLNNVSRFERIVELGDGNSPVKVTDLISGKEVSPEIILKPCDVRLLTAE